MAPMGKHEMDESTTFATISAPAGAPGKRRDHLWVLFVIAVCVLAEVWASWVGVGALSGFPRLGRIPTDWVLAVAMEGLWAYALYAWLAASPGPRSRTMAMWTCGVVFALSLAGQVIYHEITAPPGTPLGRRFVIGFVTSLPVIVLALIAVLVHLRHEDRAEAEATWQRERAAEKAAAVARAEADERAHLRRELADVTARTEAEVTALREELAGELEERDRAVSEAMSALADARSEAESATARADRLERKLAGPAGRSKTGAGRRGTAPRTGTAAGGGTGPEDDLELEAKALKLLATNLDMSGAELARKLNVSDGYGRKLRRRLTETGPLEAVPDRPDDRTGTASEDRS
jgi:hypothetical protein